MPVYPRWRSGCARPSTAPTASTCAFPKRSPDRALTSPDGVDGVDLSVLSVLALIGYLLAVGRVGRLPVFPRRVVGNLDYLMFGAENDGVDLGVWWVYPSSFIGYLRAVGL